ncbi:WS/DGAT domain-containing protein [Amycolatopsis sp. NPDC026612]|uniref:WS/DGAT domain-containing protein n=1 Tax=Amycolatopsis sp. NPDC026612 TaxID=3155466 RepID=UPI0033FAA681
MTSGWRKGNGLSGSDLVVGVDGSGGALSVLVCRTHHAMADGIRLTQVLFSLLDPAGAEAAPHAKVGGAAPHREPVAQPVVRLGAAMLRALGDAGAEVQQRAARVHPVLETAVALPVFGASAAAGFLSSALSGGPRRVFDTAAGSATTVWHSVTGAGDLLGPSTATGLWDGEPGVEKTAAWGDPVPLLTVAWMGHETGTIVNDVCTALVAGPRTAMTLAGAEVDGIVGWAPCSGRQAITVCIFSYAGQVRFGFGTDRRLIPDPELPVDALAEEFAELAQRA